MSPIWKKKKKSNPISRFVNEIRSARHGESMVVQTGFPTSLVDLVVKNQSRLAKNKNLNGKKYKSLKLNVGSEIQNQDYRCEDKCYENEDDAKDEKDCGDKDDDCCGCGSEFEIEHRVSRRKGVITKLVKMLFVLILGLGTKKVAVAVTLSACVLLFVEFLLRSWVGWRGLRKCAVKKEVEEEEEDETNLVDLREEFESLVKERRDREIENECKNNEDCEEKAKGRVIELESDKDGDCDEKKGGVVDCEERVSEGEKVRCRKKTGGGKAKQFRKYVVKKLGRDSKSRRRKKDEKLAQQDVQSNCEGDGETESIGKESIGEEQEKVDEDDEDDGDNAEGNVVVDCASDVDFQDDVGRRRTNWNLKSLILIVIVLAGLVGGRIMAMALSMVWLAMVVALSKKRKSSAVTRR